MIEEKVEATKVKQEVEYEDKRRAKQKLQFIESKLCTRQVNLEKNVEPVTVMTIQLRELAEDIGTCEVEREEVRKHYDEEMNKQDNVISKLKFQVQVLDRRIGERQKEHDQMQAQNETREDRFILQGLIDSAPQLRYCQS